MLDHDNLVTLNFPICLFNDVGRKSILITYFIKRELHVNATQLIHESTKCLSDFQWVGSPLVSLKRD